jgi:hypothetical protein
LHLFGAEDGGERIDLSMRLRDDKRRECHERHGNREVPGLTEDGSMHGESPGNNARMLADVRGYTSLNLDRYCTKLLFRAIAGPANSHQRL